MASGAPLAQIFHFMRDLVFTADRSGTPTSLLNNRTHDSLYSIFRQVLSMNPSNIPISQYGQQREAFSFSVLPQKQSEHTPV